MAKQIELTRGFVALVDDIDFEYLRQFNWCVSHGYAARNAHKNGGFIFMHRVVLERKLGRPLSKEERADHEDRKRAHNTRDNIRLATHKQNVRNRSKVSGNTSSRFIGVSWHKTGRKWNARIKTNNKLIHLGCFNNEEDAAKVYDQAALFLFGEFASLNFPGEWLKTAYEVYMNINISNRLNTLIN